VDLVSAYEQGVCELTEPGLEEGLAGPAEEHAHGSVFRQDRREQIHVALGPDLAK
jgi:hypothetical protein